MTSCNQEWLSLGMPRDSTRRVRQYTTNHVKNTDRIILTQSGARMIELSKYLTLLSCFADKEGSPAQMEQAYRKLTEMDICIIIISTLPQDLVTAYLAKKCQHFPVCVKIILVDLTPMKLEPNATKTKIDSIMVKSTCTAPPPNPRNNPRGIRGI